VQLVLFGCQSYFALDHVQVHDMGTMTAVGVSFRGGTLFLVSSELKSVRSASSIFFQPFAVMVNSLHADSTVSTAAFVGAMSMPFCESGQQQIRTRESVDTEAELIEQGRQTIAEQGSKSTSVSSNKIDA